MQEKKEEERNVFVYLRVMIFYTEKKNKAVGILDGHVEQLRIYAYRQDGNLAKSNHRLRLKNKAKFQVVTSLTAAKESVFVVSEDGVLCPISLFVVCLLFFFFPLFPFSFSRTSTLKVAFYRCETTTRVYIIYVLGLG